MNSILYYRFKTTQIITFHVHFGIMTLILYCKFHLMMLTNKRNTISLYDSTNILTSWSKKGIVTEIAANSTTVRCLSNHLSSFAVIAEDPSIEIPTVATNISNTTSIVATTITSATTAIDTVIATTDITASTASDITATAVTTTNVTTSTDVPPTPITTSTTTTESTVTTDISTSMNISTCNVNLMSI